MKIMKRFLDCTASDFENMKKKELLEAISASEGRVLVCETIGILQPMLGDVTNAEFVASMGADMILLNMYDVNHPVIQGLPKTEDREVVRKIKQLTGRPVGINLEPMEQGKESSVRAFAEAGADIILLPAPGTVPGITMEYVRSLVVCAHSLGKMTLTAIGTSQEGADTDTIKEIALMCKMTGTDLHHLGDAGYGGMALPENILEYGKVIRGIRHTYHRMAVSIRR